MAKGYWIANVAVKDQAAYDEYRRLNAIAFDKYGGKFIVRGGKYEVAFGDSRPHNVVLEFPDYDTALACYRSAEYKQASEFLKKGCDVNLIIVQGYDAA